MMDESEASSLDDRIRRVEYDIGNLRKSLDVKERELNDLKQRVIKKGENCNQNCSRLSYSEVTRYSRQMLVDNFGVKGQLSLKNSHVLIVGAGGLGCPAALYLVAAGIGKLTIIDFDSVEASNLHRQILHRDGSIGVPKVQSAAEVLRSLNPNVDVVPVELHADSKSLKLLFAENKFDVVVDGTDNVPTRYLLNDICVMNNIPLVMGSALQYEGQCTVYNYRDGPCYRCIYPVPPPPETVTSCGDGGVIGAIPGLIGVVQALETIKILIKSDSVLFGRIFIFDGSDSTVRNVKLRGKRKDCVLCGEQRIMNELIDYEQFCGSKANDKVNNIDILDNDSNVSITSIADWNKILLVDVRPTNEYEMCCLKNSVNFPFSNLRDCNVLKLLRQCIQANVYKGDCRVFVICRRGNDSQRAVKIFKNQFNEMNVNFFNIQQGFLAYSKCIDQTFPIY